MTDAEEQGAADVERVRAVLPDHPGGGGAGRALVAADRPRPAHVAPPASTTWPGATRACRGRCSRSGSASSSGRASSSTSSDRWLLTPAGRDLQDLVFGLGQWGARWQFDDPREEELDPALMWWVHDRLDYSALSDRRVVIEFRFPDHPDRFWILRDAQGPSVCTFDPGFGVDATVERRSADDVPGVARQAEPPGRAALRGARDPGHAGRREAATERPAAQPGRPVRGRREASREPDPVLTRLSDSRQSTVRPAAMLGR